MLSAVNKELWPGCQKHLQLSLVARVLNMKVEHHMSQREFDDISQLIKVVVSYANLVTENFYSAKRLIRGLGLPVEKIHCCNNGCMLFCGEDNDLTICKIVAINDTRDRLKQKQIQEEKQMYPTRKCTIFLCLLDY